MFNMFSKYAKYLIECLACFPSIYKLYYKIVFP